MKKLICLVALIILLVKSNSAQQQASLGIFNLQVTPDTTVYNDIITYSFTLQNTGDSTFSGDVMYRCFINNNITDIFTLGISDTVLLQGSGTLVVNLQDQVDSARYAGGSDIIVIWPVAINSNVPTTDSAIVTLFIDEVSGIETPDGIDRLHIFYDSRVQSLYIDYSNIEHLIEEVSLINLTGQQLQTFDYAVKEIKLTHLPEAPYFLYVKSRDGAIITFKLIKD